MDSLSTTAPGGIFGDSSRRSAKIASSSCCVTAAELLVVVSNVAMARRGCSSERTPLFNQANESFS